MASDLRDAATIVLVRDRADAGIEVFLVQRHGASGFMANAYVFPGGKLDDADLDPALRSRIEGLDVTTAAARLGEDDGARALGLHVAALRETFEESGILVGRCGRRDRLPEVRAKVADGSLPFADALDALDAVLEPSAIAPLSRWITPIGEPRRFDTRFFVAAVSAIDEAWIGSREVVAGEWLEPAAALDRAARGALKLPPPTHRTIELLAGFARARDAVEAAMTRTPPRIAPAIVPHEGTFVLALPGDPLHPERERAIEGATRFELEGPFAWMREALKGAAR